jgi:rusticyanin
MAIAMPLVLVLALVVFDLTRTTTAAALGASTGPGSGRASPGRGGCGPADSAASPSDTAAMNSPDMSLSTFIGKQAGTRLAGNAPTNLGADQVRTLGDQAPAGASADACANQITFTGVAVSFVVEAVPSDNPDMTFRIAGLVNPAVVVQQGADITVEFINADTDQAHGWLVTAGQPPFAFHPDTRPAIPGAQASVIGDPVGGRQGARTIAFNAGAAGQYQYLCPIPGHAEMGMHAGFIVAP